MSRVSLVLFLLIIGGGATETGKCSHDSQCQNGGSCYHGGCECTDHAYGFYCEHIYQPYGGASCTTDNDCENGGSCEDAICNCPPQYGGKKCEVSLYCTDEGPSCMNGGTCADGTCICAVGWAGSHCGYSTTPPSVPTDNCPDGGCLNGGSCVDGNCVCRIGFNGSRCQDNVSGCSPPCEHNGFCSHGLCICKPGWTGADCDTFDPKCDCPIHATCRTIGSKSTCFCNPGYVGQNCTSRIVQCDPACENGGKCVDLGPYGKQCICPRGVTGQWCQINDPGECNTKAVFTCIRKHFPNTPNITNQCVLGDVYTHCAQLEGPACGFLVDRWCKGVWANCSANLTACASTPSSCDADQYHQCEDKVLNGNWSSVCTEQLQYALCGLDAACAQQRKYHCDVALYECPQGKVNSTLCPSVGSNPNSKNNKPLGTSYRPTNLATDFHFLGEHVEAIETLDRWSKETK